MAIILIVDDEENIRFLISAALSSTHTVIEASNGQEGRLLFEKHRPDIAIIDLTMPGMSGFELIRSIRASGSAVKIIATSGLFDRKEDRDVMLKAGADLCLAKPVDIPTIKQAINDLLSKIIT